MQFEWDEAKARSNRAKHGVDFTRVEDFDFNNALYALDDAMDYGEERFTAIGLIRLQVYRVVFVERADRIRVISLRRADAQERKEFYER